MSVSPANMGILKNLMWRKRRMKTIYKRKKTLTLFIRSDTDYHIKPLSSIEKFFYVILLCLKFESGFWGFFNGGIDNNSL